MAELVRCVASGAKIILSKLPVGDLATQFFADRNLFCAGRVAQDDMARVAKVQDTELRACEAGQEFRFFFLAMS